MSDPRFHTKQSQTQISKRLKASSPGLSNSLHEFLEKDTEQRSLHVRSLFEQASNAAMTYDQLDDFVKKSGQSFFYSILSHDSNYSFISNDREALNILCNYKLFIFDQNKIYELDENLYGIEVTPDTIFTYASHAAAARIPGLASALAKSQWRTKEILAYSNGMPMLVLRGCNDTNPSTTPSELACDANNIITQQLINYQNDLKTKNRQSIIEFPKLEGRGAIFSINNVPFHSYNSYSRNDELCAFIGLISRDRSNKFQRDWEVNASTSWKRGDGVTLEDLRKPPYNNYGLFPGIVPWQKEGIYCWGLVAPLDVYIERSLMLGSLIAREDGTTATKVEIARALGMLNEYKKSLLPDSASDVVMSHRAFQRVSL